MKAMYSIALLLMITGTVQAGTEWPALPASVQEPDPQPVPNFFRRLSLNYLKVEFRTGMATISTNNLPAGWSTSGRLAIGGGFDIVLKRGGTGMFSFGLHYTTAGLDLKETTSAAEERENHLRLQYVKLPIQYHLFLGRANKVFIGGGGYGAALLLPAVQKVKVFDEKEMSRFDAGFIASAGTWLGSRWMVKAQAEWGMIDIDKSRLAQLGKNTQYLLTIGYTIPFRKRGYDVNPNKVPYKDEACGD